ncbi:MAG: GNAT family N-acetyltransferase [Methylobacterium sp.]|uniref:GNAT family N-acetyltransferase n=1 Tax=Methylobacterium sp. TaxID=409 RepID=UPI003452F9A5|nr:GNAT family N-acetyltransferase [Methylobacterium sp.]
MQVIIESYQRDRPRNFFECGRRPIDNWYKNNSKKCFDRVEYRVFEAIFPATGRVVGYYALQIGNESMAALPSKPADYTKNYTAFPAVHLAFLGVHRECQRKGVGTALLSDVFDKVYQISEIAGMYALTLQSYDEESTAFYSSLGFEPYSDSKASPKMLMPIRTIRALVEGE